MFDRKGLYCPAASPLRDQTLVAIRRWSLAVQCREALLLFRAMWVHPHCWDEALATSIQRYSDAAGFYATLIRQLHVRILAAEGASTHT